LFSLPIILVLLLLVVRTDVVAAIPLILGICRIVLATALTCRNKCMVSVLESLLGDTSLRPFDGDQDRMTKKILRFLEGLPEFAPSEVLA
jgi:hypothetical protein